MPVVKTRDMEPRDNYFVATCTHVHESSEIDACARRRLTWLKSMYESGLRVKVGAVDGSPVGFLYIMPIEVCPGGALGKDLLAIPCLFVEKRAGGKAVGRSLVVDAEDEVRRQGKKGLATVAFYHDFWFMPAPFFERCGFTVADRKGKTAALWKALDPSAEPPRLLERNYIYEPAAGRVVVDLFWTTFCGTSDIEAHRVREVAAEFGDAVVLREYCADDRATLLRYQIPRGIFVNGREIGWGHEAPREGIRKAIGDAIKKVH
ncbi:MAG TPA: hypothetical protein VMY05_01400 [Acidobacteriota bacterium]|nr:hypothetical protein [Acidobacteriota bacterium]